MGKKPKRRNATAKNPDAYVENILRENFRSMWEDGGFHAAAVQDNTTRDMQWLHEYGYCNYEALEKAKADDGFARFDKRSHLNQIAAETLETLQSDAVFLSMVSSKQEAQSQPTVPTQQTTKSANTSDTKQVVKGGETDTPQTAEECSKLVSEKIKLVMAARTEKIEVAGCTLMEHAEQKARKEMEAEFDFESLCEQGKQLYRLVLHDKTARLHRKLKHRSKWKEKKKSTMQPS